MKHSHSVFDTDTFFLIDPVSRTVKNASGSKQTIVQFDHNSERVTFECPRYIDGHDMSACDRVEVHYLNVSARNGNEIKGLYECDDLQIKADDKDKVTCSWLISQNATQYVGKLSFLVRFCCVSDGVITYAWNTTVSDAITVSDGLNATDEVLVNYADILGKWKEELFNAGYINADTMQANIADLNAALDVERKRIDQFVKLPNGSTTGDAELMDIRIGADGVTYESAGTAVRKQLKRVSRSIDNITKIGVNKADYSQVILGYYVDQSNGEYSKNDAHCVIKNIPIIGGKHYVFGLYNVSEDFYGNYAANNALRVAFFDSTYKFIGGHLNEIAIVAPVEAAYLSLSWVYHDVLKPMVADGDELPDYEEFACSLDTEKANVFTKDEALSFIPMAFKRKTNPVIQTGGNLRHGNSILLENHPTSCKKNLLFLFSADIVDFSSVVIGFMHTGSQNLHNRITIDQEKILVSNYYTDNIKTINHGLNIDKTINVLIKKNYNLTADITVASSGASFSINVPWGDVTQSLVAFVRSNHSNLSNCSLTLVQQEIDAKIYAFGDSYFNYSPSRWLYYADKFGFTNNMFANGHPGEASAAAFTELIAALQCGTPKYLLWGLGMNDGNDTADTSEPNKAWLETVQKVIAVCEQYEITPILATIPTVPSVYNEHKNEWIRSSGHRYIDFAQSVGASEDGTWHDGMLSTDGVHPSDRGAIALFFRALHDFPEIAIN